MRGCLLHMCMFVKDVDVQQPEELTAVGGSSEEAEIVGSLVYEARQTEPGA